MFAPLDQTPVDQAPLSISPSANIPMAPDAASPLAGQVSWAFATPYADAYSALANGNQDMLRNSLASQETFSQNDSVAETLRKNPFAVSPNMLASMTAPKDPRDIIEKKFADKSIDNLVAYDETSVDEPATGIRDVARDDPAGLAEDMTAGKERMAWRQLLLNTSSQLESDVNNQSKFGYFWDQVKSLSMIYPEVKTRGLVPGTGLMEGGPLGHNWEAQATALGNMPYDQRISAFISIINKLKQDNPSLALSFSRAMYGQSLQERSINDLWSVGAILDLTSVGNIVKGLVGRRLSRSAVRDIMDRGADISASGLDTVPAVAIPEAAGRTVESAMTQTVNRIIDQEGTRITPERTALEGVMDIMKGDMDLATATTPEHVKERVAQMERTLEFNKNSLDPQTISDMAEIQRTLDEYKNQNALALKPGGFAREIFARLTEAYDNSIGDFINARLGVQQVQRIGNALADRRVLEKVWDYTKGMSTGLSDNVINMTVPRLNRFTGHYEVSTIFGRNSGELFNDVTEALNTIEHGGLRVSMIDGQKLVGVKPGESGVSLGNIGGKYYAMISRPIREIEHYIRDAVVETAESKAGNHGLLNQFGLPAWIRTPEEVLPYLENLNRKVAIYSPQVLRTVLEEHVAKVVDKARAKLRGKTPSEIFANLGKGSQFQRMLDDLQRARNPVTGRPGKALDTPQDVYAYYMTNFQRAPDPIEYDAYFAAKRGMAMDYSFRNMSILKNMGRLGNEEHRIGIVGKNGPEQSKWFVGALRKEFPSGDATIAYIGEHAGEEMIKKADNFAQTKIGKEVIPKIASGEYKLVEVYNVELDPLNGFSNLGENRIQYVITKNTETRPLSFQQIPRLPGFHIEYDHPWYLKQPKIRKNSVDGTDYHWYEGDSTAFLLQNRLMGNDLTKIMNEVRVHLLNNRSAEAEQAARALPIGWKELKSWFEPQRGPGGERFSPRFNLTEDFRVVPKNKMSIELDNSIRDKYKDQNFRDGTRTGSPARQFQVEFTGERDAFETMEMSNKGTRYNPMYSYDPAQPLDPITSMNRALSRVTNSMFMDDVKISSMENWLRRNKDYLDTRGLGDADLMSAPFYHFAEAKITGATDKTVAARIEAERWMIKQFNGTPNFIDTTLAAIQDKMMDSVYGSESKFTKSAATIGKWGVTAIKDGPTYLRYMAFKAGLGMFSLPQFFVQANTYVTIAGIAGYTKAAQGSAAAVMHQWSRFNRNPEVLRTMDKRLQTFGWKPGEFIEAFEAIKGTGFDFVSGETNSLMGYAKTDDIFKSGARTFLDLGDIPFKEGERAGRYGAWYTAFKEWRDANPVGRLTQLDRAKILQRADDLAGNMTLASKSGLQTGALSFPTQFLGYSMRLTELALGHRLTWQQKARLFGTYWAAYGFPVAMGITGIPEFGDMWKESITKNGYNPNETSVASLVNEGLPSAFLKLVTGNTYNVGERYGNPGLDVIRDFMSKDKSVIESFMGASGSLVGGAWNGMDGYWKFLGSFLRSDDKAYGMTASDLVQPFKTFASVNNFWRAEMAVNTGVYMSKNETPLADNVGLLNTIFMSTTGVQPHAVDTQTITRMTKEREELQKAGLNSFIRNVHRAMDAIKNKDPQEANVFFNNAKADLNISGYPDERRNQAWNAALSGRTLPERELWNYWMTNVNPEEKASSAEIYSNAMRNLK